MENVSNPENLPVPRATVEDMERAREVAIARYGDAFDALAEACRAGGRACISRSKEGLSISEAARDALLGKRGRDDRSARETWIAEMTRTTDAAMWQHLIDATDLERLMDRQARDEWRKSLCDNPPPATVGDPHPSCRTVGPYLPARHRQGVSRAGPPLSLA